MAEFFLNDTSNESCADGTTGFDMSTTQGSANTVTSGNVSDTPFVESLTFDETVGTSGATGDYSVSLDIGSVSGPVDIRYRLQRLNSGCAVQESSGYSGTQRDTGILAATLSFSPSWAAGDVLRLSVEISRPTGEHGNKSITVNTGDTDSSVAEPAGTETGTPVVQTLSLSAVAPAATFHVDATPVVQTTTLAMPSVGAMFSVTASVSPVTVSLSVPTISAGLIGVGAPVVQTNTLAVVEPAATFFADAVPVVQTATLSIVGQTATFHVMATVSPVVLSLATPSPSASTGGVGTPVVQTGSLVVVNPAATFQIGAVAGSVATTLTVPAVTASESSLIGQPVVQAASLATPAPVAAFNANGIPVISTQSLTPVSPAATFIVTAMVSPVVITTDTPSVTVSEGSGGVPVVQTATLTVPSVSGNFNASGLPAVQAGNLNAPLVSATFVVDAAPLVVTSSTSIPGLLAVVVITASPSVPGITLSVPAITATVYTQPYQPPAVSSSGASYSGRGVTVIPNSRIHPFILPHRFDVVRKVDRQTKQLGTIVQDCTLETLYQRVPGRLTVLREFSENILDPMNRGSDSAHIYRLYLVFSSVPLKLLQGDFVEVRWGTKPNFFTPNDALLGPALLIETPEGLKVFEFQNGQYISDNGYVLQQVDGQWCLSRGAFEHCFLTDNPLCETFPDGFKFKNKTGKPLYYEILRYENQLDDIGHYHHTRLELDCVGTDEQRGQ